jgi:hypothetical protein
MSFDPEVDQSGCQLMMFSFSKLIVSSIYDMQAQLREVTLQEENAAYEKAISNCGNKIQEKMQEAVLLQRKLEVSYKILNLYSNVALVHICIIVLRTHHIVLVIMFLEFLIQVIIKSAFYYQKKSIAVNLLSIMYAFKLIF